MPDRSAQALLRAGRTTFGPSVRDRTRIFELLVVRLDDFAVDEPDGPTGLRLALPRDERGGRSTSRASLRLPRSRERGASRRAPERSER